MNLLVEGTFPPTWFSPQSMMSTEGALLRGRLVTILCAPAILFAEAILLAGGMLLAGAILTVGTVPSA